MKISKKFPNTKRKWSPPVKKGLKAFLIGVATLFFAENVLLATNNLQPNRPVVGLKVPSLNQPLKFAYQGNLFQVWPEEVLTPDGKVRLTNQFLQFGHRGPIIKKFLDQNKAALGLVNLKSTTFISQTKLNLKVLEIQSQVDTDTLPIRPNFVGDIDKTLTAQDGHKLNVSNFTVLLADNLSAPPKTPLSIPMIATFATHKEEELLPIRKQAKEFLSGGPIVITSGNKVFTLTTADLRSLMTLVERPNPKDPKKLSLILRLDDSKLNQRLGEYAQEVEKVTGAEFDDHDARVFIYAQFYSPGNRHLMVVPTGQKLAAADTNRVLGSETVSGEKKVYLTFDDGPNSLYHPMILDILKSENIKATFFLVGQNAVKDDQVARRTADQGYIIGNHSNTHSFLPNLPAKNIFGELTTTNNILKPINHGQDIKLFRPPYGGVNLSVKQSADSLGLKLYLWDVDPRDWSEPPVDELVRRVVSNVHPGSDVLLHSNHLVTVRALPKIIETLRNQGYTFDTLN